MPIIQERLITPSGGSTIFEVTQRCNNNCLYCYNVWKGDQPYPQGELDTAGAKEILLKVSRECPTKYFAFSGGEPLLRQDIVELISYSTWLGLVPTLITNGTLLDSTKVTELIRAGTQLFELPLLSSEKSIHDGLCRNKSFDTVIESLISIKEKQGRVVVVFVATKWNIQSLEETLNLCLALGVDGLMLNRFNPGGEGMRHIDELLPSMENMKEALEIANQFAKEYRFSISCGIAIHPCLIDTTPFAYVGFGYCGAGTYRSYYTIDSIGNLRACNHTPSILGNFLNEPYSQLIARKKVASFMKARPEFCDPCPYRFTCQGGCKASAQVCYGDLCHIDPFLERNIQYASIPNN
ncbi:MAG: radical SAM protein [bacterium]